MVNNDPGEQRFSTHPRGADLDPPSLNVTILVVLTPMEGSCLMLKSPVPISLGKSPLTDPWSVGSSVLFHVVLFLLASLTVVLNVGLPMATTHPKALYAEVDPVDNAPKCPTHQDRAEAVRERSAACPIYPLFPIRMERRRVGRPAIQPPRRSSPKSYPCPSPDRASRSSALYRAPTPLARGLIPGSGSGGGSGAGGGSGGGAGRGIGPGTQFFGARDHAHSFAYVIDCSGSMATRNSLEIAKREMLASINQLPPDTQFAVIFYNLNARLLSDPQGQKGLMTATAPNKARVQTQMAAIAPEGGTDHMSALREALRLKPEVIFFLTDADLMSNNDVNEILAEVGSTRIQAVEFGRGTELDSEPRWADWRPRPAGHISTST